MISYFLRRVFHAAAVLWATFTATFFLLYVLPGDRALSKLGADSGGVAVGLEQLARLRQEMGLDQPILVQYLRALWRALHGDFGVSGQTGGDALQMFATGMPETLKLASCALSLGLALGVGLALLASYVRSPAARQFLLAMPVLGVSVPPFWVGLILLQFFSFRWHLLPAIGNAGFASLVLPATVLAIPKAALVAQILSRSLDATMKSPYIETALSRGASRSRVLLRHAFRNSTIPVITALGMAAGQLIAGSVVVETVFSRSGIGLITVKAVTYQDTPVVLVAVVFAAAVFVTVNLIVDLLYPLINRRIDIGARRPAIRGA
jgi:peptide/nickel transport system permease protein